MTASGREWALCDLKNLVASGHKELLAASGRKSPSSFDQVVRQSVPFGAGGPHQ